MKRSAEPKRFSPGTPPRQRVLTVALALICVLASAWAAPPLSASAADCSLSLQAQVDAAPVGSIVIVPACLYRETVTIAKPLTLDGQGQAEIRGADVWTNWIQTDNTWVSASALPSFSDGVPVVCLDSRCGWPAQVFVDGAPLVQVAPGTAPTLGQFSLNSARQVVLADNPNGSIVEVSTRTAWINTTSDSVTIQGFTMRYAANPALAGAVGNRGHNWWTLQDNNLYMAHGAIVSLDASSDPNSHVQVLRNDIAGSGFEGVIGWQANNAVISHNNVYWNNTEGFYLDWAGGGIKLSQSRDATIDANNIHDNQGWGAWCDDQCSNFSVSNNWVYRNGGRRDTGPDGVSQIFFETSDGAMIDGNAVWGSTGNWPGIYAYSSADVEIQHNLVMLSDIGIKAYDQNRPGRQKQGMTNVRIHDNWIAMSGTQYEPVGLYWIDDEGRTSDPSANDGGWHNAFWYPTPENGHSRFIWAHQWMQSLAPFADTPGCAGCRYLSDAEHDELLASWGIPLNGVDAGSESTLPTPANLATLAKRSRSNNLPTGAPAAH